MNITKLDPFYLNEYLMHFESTQIEGKALFKDVYNHGLGAIKIVDVRLDFHKKFLCFSDQTIVDFQSVTRVTTCTAETRTDLRKIIIIIIYW